MPSEGSKNIKLKQKTKYRKHVEKNDYKKLFKNKILLEYFSSAYP